LALVSSAGFVAPGQPSFDEGVRGGDFGFRQIGGDVAVKDLRESHRSESFDHAGLAQDPNLAFPLDRLRELVQRGRIGELNGRHLSFMGSITAPGRLSKQTAPEAARWLVEDKVDVALLVPV
jgi:D-proline reductase (dithiol) PrdB